MSRKKEFIEAKVKTQGELLLPVELQATAKKAWEVCSPQRKCHLVTLYGPLKFIFMNKIKFIESLQRNNTKMVVIERITW